MQETADSRPADDFSHSLFTAFDLWPPFVKSPLHAGTWSLITGVSALVWFTINSTHGPARPGREVLRGGDQGQPGRAARSFFSSRIVPLVKTARDRQQTPGAALGRPEEPRCAPVCPTPFDP